MQLISLDSKGHPVLDFHLMMDMIQSKLGRSPTDFEGTHSHFEKWKNANKGRAENDPEGKHWRSSQVWYLEYQADPNGYAATPAYHNYWHIWIKWVCKKSADNHDSPPKVNFFKLWKRMSAANGIEPGDHRFMLQHVKDVAATLDEVRGKALIHQYTESFKLDWQLDWALELTDTIMGWIGPEYWNKTLKVVYND